MKRNVLIVSLVLFLACGFAVEAAAADIQSILGKWLVRTETPQGPIEMEFDLKQEGNQLVGTVFAFQTSIPFSAVTFEDPVLKIEIIGGANTYRLTGTLKDNKFTGTWEQVGTEMKGNWSAERKAPAAPVTPSDTAAGTWSSIAATPSGELTVTLEFKQEGEKVTGVVATDMGSLPIQAGSFKDKKLQFNVEAPGATYHVEGIVEGDKFSGKWSVASGESGTFMATRKTAGAAAAPQPAAAPGPSPILGSWDSVASSPDGNLPFQVVIKQAEGVLTGSAAVQGVNIPLTKVTFADNQFSFEVEYAGGTYKIEATLKDGKLTGKWSSISGSESGAWSAEKKIP